MSVFNRENVQASLRAQASLGAQAGSNWNYVIIFCFDWIYYFGCFLMTARENGFFKWKWYEVSFLKKFKVKSYFRYNYYINNSSRGLHIRQESWQHVNDYCLAMLVEKTASRTGALPAGCTLQSHEELSAGGLPANILLFVPQILAHFQSRKPLGSGSGLEETLIHSGGGEPLDGAWM